jgi:Clp amino terminal domain, pathogenicity island component
MFERFTDRARRVVVLAQEEARLLNHNYIGTEHILLGMLSEPDGVAGETLRSMGVSLDAARHEVEEIIGQGQRAPTGHIPFTPRAKKVLELSLREALQLGHNYIGTEHILLGLLREGGGVAVQVLIKRGVDLSEVRRQVVALLERRPAGEAGVAVGQTHVRELGGYTGIEYTGMRSPFVVGAGYHPREEETEPPELARVIPIARTIEIEGVRLVLLSLEIWSRWLDLRLAVVGLELGRLAEPPLPYGRWGLSDDAGTAYQAVGASVSGDNRLHVYQVSFSPSPPAEATTLLLTLAAEGRDEIQVVVELSQR